MVKTALYITLGINSFLFYQKLSGNRINLKKDLLKATVFVAVYVIISKLLTPYICEPFLSFIIVCLQGLLISSISKSKQARIITLVAVAYILARAITLGFISIFMILVGPFYNAFRLAANTKILYVLTLFLIIFLTYLYCRSHWLEDGLSIISERDAVPFVVLLFLAVTGFWIVLGRRYIKGSDEQFFYYTGILFFFFIGLFWIGYQIYYSVHKHRQYLKELARLENEKDKINVERKELRRRVHDMQKVMPALLRHSAEAGAELSPKCLEELKWIEREEAENTRRDLDKAKVFASTNVDCLDNLILDLFAKARKKKISFNADIHNSFRPLFQNEIIGPEAFMGLLANLVDNAISAIDKNEGGMREILIVLWKSSDGIFVLEVSDSGVPFPEEILRHFGELGATTNGEGHGNGIHNMMETVRLADASLTIENFGPGNLYTKRITIEFDGQNRLLLPRNDNEQVFLLGHPYKEIK